LSALHKVGPVVDPFDGGKELREADKRQVVRRQQNSAVMYLTLSDPFESLGRVHD